MPRFSVDHMDRTVDPTRDFYAYATGTWARKNPVPADKSRWGSFGELIERNFGLLRIILEESRSDRRAPAESARRKVGDFFASAMDTKRLDSLRFEPIADDLRRVDGIRSTRELGEALADLHRQGIDGLFETAALADRKNSSVYAFYLWQGGLSLPDRDYYLKEEFAGARAGFLAHVQRMFELLGELPGKARRHAATVLDLETGLARVSRTATEQRDAVKNYHRFGPVRLARRLANFPWTAYLARRAVGRLPYLVVGQPEFFDGMDALLDEHDLESWKVYLRWHLLHDAAPYLHAPLEAEDFAFFRRSLLGQPTPEPRWKRAAIAIDQCLGEALGRLYVERHFPPEARARTGQLVADLREVFRDRLSRLEWMTGPTRRRALAKFARFTSKIGHPDRFRDYRPVRISPTDLLGNVRRAGAFDVQRRVDRVGKPVDRTEWGMTPPTVNAYFNATQNEIVFPAGILQPPFFDVAMDDAVNYGGIGAVIGHEITHGYDDQGRRFDPNGNLRDWWSGRDATAFQARARRIVKEYDGFEALPGRHVNGSLTLGENIADFGGVSIAYEALERRLSKEPRRRRTVDGLSPEQRFFIAWAQIWRENCRAPERRRRLTVDPHSPGRFRAIGPITNFPEFYAAFDIPPGAP
ncbi:MAG: M13 family metallopeptidase, partial [Thermoplasmata archaeon]